MTEMYEDGAAVLENGMTLPYVWSSLHVNARMEVKLENDPRFQYEVNRFSRELERLFDGLSEVEAAQWLALCEAAGITIFGVVGLSWCKGATIDMVSQAWERCSYELGTTPETQRPATLINQRLLPKAETFTELVMVCNDDAHRVALVFAALGDSIKINLSADEINAINAPRLRAMVRARHDLQTAHTQDAEAQNS